MSFRSASHSQQFSHTVGNRSPVYTNPFEEVRGSFRAPKEFKKRISQAIFTTKGSIGEVLQGVNGILRERKSIRGLNLEEEGRTMSPGQSFYDETSILHAQRSQVDDIKEQISLKDESIHNLQLQNDCLHLLLDTEIKRVDQENYEKVCRNEEEILHLADKINQLKNKGYRINTRVVSQSEQLLQERVRELDARLEEMGRCREEMEGVITRLYRDGLSVCPQNSRRKRPLVNNEIRGKIEECVQMLDQIVM